MENKLKNKMKILDKAPKKGLSDKDRDIIKVFSYFVWGTNPDYLYNESYLKNYLNKFERQINNFNQKRRQVNKIMKNLKAKKLTYLDQIDIIIDGIFHLEYKKSTWKYSYYHSGDLGLLDNDICFVEMKFIINGKEVSDYFKVDIDNILDELIGKMDNWNEQFEGEV